MKTFLQAARMLAVLSVLTGIAYPLLVWSSGLALFREKAEGSLIKRNGQVIGSRLIAQRFDTPRYFHSRPSAGDFATVASGASNLAWTSAKLAERIAAHPAGVAADLTTTSGSGLDPHSSPEAIEMQISTVIAARSLDPLQEKGVREWIAGHTEGGHYGPRFVNVLELNLALDQIDSRQ